VTLSISSGKGKQADSRASAELGGDLREDRHASNAALLWAYIWLSTILTSPDLDVGRMNFGSKKRGPHVAVACYF